MAFGFVKRIFPNWQSALLAVAAAVLLILAFPDFEYWFLAWFALVPLMIAVEREKESVVRSFVTGWIFGTVFFFGTCYWLTFAPITYAHFPPWLAYSGMVFVALVVGLFPALFSGILSVLLRKLGSWGYLSAPFVWVFTEFLRYWLTGNNWNAIGYSQAFTGRGVRYASLGGVELVSFVVIVPAIGLLALYNNRIAIRTSRGLREFAAHYRRRYLHPIRSLRDFARQGKRIDPRLTAAQKRIRKALAGETVVLVLYAGVFLGLTAQLQPAAMPPRTDNRLVAIQPNVPMSGVDQSKWNQLRQRQIDAAETELKELPTASRQLPTTVILPESPMNFMYNDDREFQQFIGDFARRNNVSVLFNSAEPDATNGKYFNSAVMVGPDGREAAQYDKIFLLPFGEAVPAPLEGILPGFVGNFSYGREYDILPVGEAKAGIMICFESHFGALSREYVRNGADVIIEMTNDGYLGPTPVLRQHLANAVFRAVETNRPVLRVTNVGITTYINERGEVIDPLPSYTEGTRVWNVSKSDGSQTFYVKYGDWFAWLCSVVTIGLLGFSIRRKVAQARA